MTQPTTDELRQNLAYAVDRFAACANERRRLCAFVVMFDLWQRGEATRADLDAARAALEETP